MTDAEKKNQLWEIQLTQKKNPKHLHTKSVHVTKNYVFKTTTVAIAHHALQQICSHFIYNR